MDFYTMEQFEIMGDAMDEIAEEEAYEADMAEMEAYLPTEEDILEMATWYGF